MNPSESKIAKPGEAQQSRSGEQGSKSGEKLGGENRPVDNRPLSSGGSQTMQGQQNQSQQDRSVKQGEDRMTDDRWPAAPHTREMRDAVNEVGTRLRNVAEHAMPAAREQWDRVGERVADQAESMEDAVTNYVRERPINSLLIAAGVGLVFGLFFFRR